MGALTEEYIRIIENGAKSAMSLEEIIANEVNEWLLSDERKKMLVGQRYYGVKNDVLGRKRHVIGEGGHKYEDKNLANNKIPHGFVRKLVDQKVGYLLGLPLTIQTNDDEYQKILNDIFNKSFLRTLKNLGKESINKGKAWLHVYYNEQGELSFKKIPSEQIIPLWRDSAHTELDALIRVYEVEVYEGKEKKRVTRVEYWDTDGVKRYVFEGGKLIPDVEVGDVDSHFYIVNGAGERIGVNWQRVPFICFKYNEEEQPLIDFVKDLVDDYDRRKSDNSNNLEDLPESIYVIQNYDGADLGEFRRNLSIYRAVKVTTDGRVDTINLQIDTEAFKTHMDMTRKDIYEFGRGVDTQAERFGGDKSGVALRFLYADLDMDCNIIETEFQASLEQLRWFIDQHIANTTGRDYSGEVVDFIFNRDIIINETDVINNARASVGIISDETIIANHPWTTNTQAELERIEAQRNREFMRFEEYQDFNEQQSDEDDAE